MIQAQDLSSTYGVPGEDTGHLDYYGIVSLICSGPEVRVLHTYLLRKGNEILKNERHTGHFLWILVNVDFF